MRAAVFFGIFMGLVLCMIQLVQGFTVPVSVIQQFRQQSGRMPVSAACDRAKGICMCGEQCVWMSNLLSCTGNCTEAELKFITAYYSNVPQDTPSPTFSSTFGVP